MTVRIKGLDRLNKKLTKLPPAAEKAICQAMEQGANEIVAMMKSLAPVDSGDLRDSIGWTWGDPPAYSQTLATMSRRKRARRAASRNGKEIITIYVGGAGVRYAHFVEFGTPEHIAGGMFKGATIPKIPAQPFFFVSWRALRRRTKSRISRAITRSAKQVAASGGSGGSGS